jgi:hypothetical protein
MAGNETISAQEASPANPIQFDAPALTTAEMVGGEAVQRCDETDRGWRTVRVMF